MRSLYLHCYIRDNWQCRYCRNRNGIHPHHVIYQSHQGPDEMNNIITLCWKCHMAHHDGKLKITVLDKTDDNVIVSFERRKGWKPS